MCVLVYVFLWKTKWGYELRAVGENPSAAEYGGISPQRQIIIAMTISGALAGMVAIGEVLGTRHNYYDGFSAEWGFLGIAVALLGRNHPLGVFIAAIFFGVLMPRGDLCRCVYRQSLKGPRLGAAGDHNPVRRVSADVHQATRTKGKV